jgi:hypothetical protein
MKMVVVFCLMVLISSCSNITKKDLGLARLSPNEKEVEQRQPLIIPDYIIK